MTDIQVFTNPDFGSVRTLTIDDIPWFVGKEVAVALGYTKAYDAVAKHVDKDDTLKWGITDNLGREQQTLIINESGLYSLILSSKLPTAKKFKRWVTSEVLPAIRTTGTYTINPAEPQRAITTDDYIKAASIVASCRNERLPYVLGLLKQGGFPAVEVLPISRESDRDTSGECARIINAAVNDYGLSLRKIGSLTGVQPVQIQRIRSGTSVPTVTRSNIIIQAIRNELPEIE